MASFPVPITPPPDIMSVLSVIEQIASEVKIFQGLNCCGFLTAQLSVCFSIEGHIACEFRMIDEPVQGGFEAMFSSFQKKDGEGFNKRLKYVHFFHLDELEMGVRNYLSSPDLKPLIEKEVK